MYQTIQVSSRVSVQGDLVEHLPNGDAVVRDGLQVYRGRPVTPLSAAAGGQGAGDFGLVGAVAQTA